MSTISIVIRCYNEERHIGRLLAGITRQTVQPDEIILVDSGSTDATLEIARHFPVRVVAIRPEEFSFGRSLNRGCRAASGDTLVFASAHIYPLYDTWLEVMTAPFADPAIALTYGRQVGNSRTKYSERQVLAKWFPSRSVARQGHPFCNNANAAVRRAVWQRLPYDEGLTGLEDMDWAQRAMQEGCQIAYVAEAPIVHVHEESFAQVLNRYRREAIAHARIFPDQRISAIDTVRLLTGNVLSDYYHAARDGVLMENVAEIPKFRFAQFMGAYRGFRQRGPVTSALKRHFYYPNSLGSAVRSQSPHQRGALIRYDELSPESPRV